MYGVSHADRVLQGRIKQGGLASATICAVISSPCSLQHETSYYIAACGIKFYPGCLHEALTLSHSQLTARELSLGWCSSCAFLRSVMLTPSQLSPHRFYIFFFVRGDFYCYWMNGNEKIHTKTYILRYIQEAKLKSKICIWIWIFKILFDWNSINAF